MKTDAALEQVRLRATAARDADAALKQSILRAARSGASTRQIAAASGFTFGYIAKLIRADKDVA